MDGNLRGLTLGQFRSLVAHLPDDVEIVLATESWYDNITTVAVPHSGDVDDGYVAVTLFPADPNGAGTWDVRQRGYVAPALTLRGEVTE